MQGIALSIKNGYNDRADISWWYRIRSKNTGKGRVIHMSNENAEKLLTFIEQSPSAFHVVYDMRRQLDAAGFVYLPENKPMNIEYGKAYYTIRNDASLIAWRMPEQEPVGFLYIAAAPRVNSPAFLIKEHPEIKKKYYITLNVEKYGGMILSSWFDRALSIAGRSSSCRRTWDREQIGFD